MDLKKRLAQLDRLSRRPDRAGAGSAPAVDRNPAERAGVLAALGLDRYEGPAGPVWYREYRDRLDRMPEQVPNLTGLVSAGAQARPSRGSLLFLDTETTGLAGGTGTLVFLLGVSWWQEDCLRTRQYFLPGPAAEPALLGALAELARPFSHVVTYNGASYDLPLLRTRSLLNRTADPLADLVGWDLLVPARRLWGHRLADCRQQSVESHVRGAVREGGDIDGARIPQTWFDFLHHGESGMLPRVLTHNHRDMVGMALILARVCRVAAWLAAAEPGGAAPGGLPAADRAEAWSLGRICERRQAGVLAAACFRYAWSVPWGGLSAAAAQRRFRRDAIRNLKRQRDWDLVAQLIGDGLECDCHDVALHTEAAILYEHRLVDLERARRHAELAGDGHRLARLDRLLVRRSR